MQMRLRPGMATLFSVVIIAFFALGSWALKQGDPKPLAWQATYQDSLWLPLKEGRLTLAGVDATLGLGSLWMISADGEPLLVSRYPLSSDDLNWRAQAVIDLNPQQMESLIKAQAWQVDMRDQAVSPAVAAALSGQPVLRMSMIPAEPVEIERITATFGSPDVKLDVREGNQAWVYGRAGMVVAVAEEQAHSIMFGLKDGATP